MYIVVVSYFHILQVPHVSQLSGARVLMRARTLLPAGRPYWPPYLVILTQQSFKKLQNVAVVSCNHLSVQLVLECKKFHCLFASPRPLKPVEVAHRQNAPPSSVFSATGIQKERIKVSPTFLLELLLPALRACTGLDFGRATTRQPLFTFTRGRYKPKRSRQQNTSPQRKHNVSRKAPSLGRP